MTQFLPCCCLLWFFLPQLIHRQTQLSCTILILTRARTWIEQALSSICLLCLCKTRTAHTVILMSYGASHLRLPVYWNLRSTKTLRDCERLWPPEPNLWMQSCSRTWEAWASRRRSTETMQSTKTFDSASEYTWASLVLSLRRWWSNAKSSEIRSSWQPWDRYTLEVLHADVLCTGPW